MKRMFLGLLALALALVAVVSPGVAADLRPVTLTLLEAGFDLDGSSPQALDVSQGPTGLTLARSQLESALTFELTLLTDIPALDGDGYSAAHFQVRDYARVQSRRSLTTRETPDGAYYAWRVTVPTLSLTSLADRGVLRYSLAFLSTDAALASGETVALDAPFTVVLHYLEDRPRAALEDEAVVAGTFRVGSSAVVVGVREALNMRVVPHEKAASVGCVLLDGHVRLLDWDTTGVWVKIRTGLREGWVPFAHVSLLERGAGE